MIIELLRVKVPSNMREKYIQKDAEIWTTALAGYPGFLGKEVWISPNDSTEVMIIIRWATKELWKAIPHAELEALDAQFTQAMGESYPFMETGEYQVRKFPQP